MRRAWPAAHRRRDAGPSWSAGRARVPCQSSALEDARPGCSRDIRPGMWTRRPGGWWPGVAGPGGWWPGVAGPGGWWPGVAGPGGWRPGVAGPGGWRPGVARPGGWRPGVARPGVWRPGVARPGGWRLRAARPGGGAISTSPTDQGKPHLIAGHDTKAASVPSIGRRSRDRHTPRSTGRTELSSVPSIGRRCRDRHTPEAPAEQNSAASHQPGGRAAELSGGGRPGSELAAEDDVDRNRAELGQFQRMSCGRPRCRGTAPGWSRCRGSRSPCRRR